jgi:hypothetical protein
MGGSLEARAIRLLNRRDDPADFGDIVETEGGEGAPRLFLA